MADSITNPEQAEDAEVRHLSQLCRDLSSLGVVRKLLYARLDWDKLVSKSELIGRGAMPPTTARSQLTRQAARGRWKRQKALRGGQRGFLRALAAT